MVPGSTFRYGSNFIRLMRSPRASSRHPMEAAASPLPSDDTTPPVTKMYFADIAATSSNGGLGCAWCAHPSISLILCKTRPGDVILGAEVGFTAFGGRLGSHKRY